MGLRIQIVRRQMRDEGRALVKNCSHWAAKA
jgi:hypothetical protein